MSERYFGFTSGLVPSREGPKDDRRHSGKAAKAAKTSNSRVRNDGTIQEQKKKVFFSRGPSTRSISNINVHLDPCNYIISPVYLGKLNTTIDYLLYCTTVTLSVLAKAVVI